MIHIPVLLKEVLQYLNPEPNENFVDCTIGQAGHAAAILKTNGPNGKVLGIEWDKDICEDTKSRIAEFQNRLILVNGSYANLKEIIGKNNFSPVSGILLDLGFSSWHTDKSEKGFSFQKNQSLDMRYNTSSGLTAEKILNEWPAEEIERILKEYGEEKFAKQIAKTIAQDRKSKKIGSTFQLVNIIKKSVPQRFQKGKIHCATRTFQALRIAVNSELENLKKVLAQAVPILSPKGRIAIISFHSLEDRIVKNFFKEEKEKGVVSILTKKPITAGDSEIKINPRSRSAKLRAAIKI